MSNLLRFKFAKFFFSNAFWLAVTVLYLESRGLPLNQVYILVSIFSIGIVVLEYPTGVIGDYISHKVSIIIGYFMFSLATLLLGAALIDSFYYYLVCILLAACATTLVSGSDDALLYNISKDFKKDFSNIQAISMVWMGVTISLGAYLSKYNLALPAFLSAISYFIAGCFALTIRKREKKKSKKSVKNNLARKGNIFSKALEGLSLVKRNYTVRILIIYGGILVGYLYSLKWLSNPLFEDLNLDRGWWGILMAVIMGLTALGSKVYGSIKKIHPEFILFFILLGSILLGFTNYLIVSYLGIFILFFFKGVAMTQIDVILNESITNSVRASIVSLKNLFLRIVSALYILLAGFILGKGNFLVLMIVTLVIIGVPAYVLLIWMRRVKKTDSV